MAADRKKGEALYLRIVRAVVEGRERLVFVAADPFSDEMVKAKRLFKMGLGSLVRVWFGKERDYTNWKRVHALGKALAENIEEFSGMDAHAVVKRLQRDSGVECDDVVLHGMPFVCPHCHRQNEIPHMVARTPRSLAFDELDEPAFQAVYSALIEHIRVRYWSSLDDAAVEQLVTLMGMGN